MGIQSDRLVRSVTAAAIVAATTSFGTAPPATGDEHADHADHARMMSQKGYERTEHSYAVPDVVLTSQDGRRVKLRTALSTSRPTILNFIFTTCTTICPVLTASLAQAQRSLGPEAKNVQIISISIDPDHDTPAKLQDYARRFNAGEGWQFLTGDREDILAMLRAFDAYRGDKMSHIPVTFMHFAPDDPWVRLEGFANAQELMREYRRHISVRNSGVS
jgi:protein SCO1/2